MKRKKEIFIIALIAFFVLSSVISSNLNSNIIETEENIQNNNSNVSRNRAKTSKTWNNFTFIHITDANWSIAASYDWCRGNGSWDDPYVIENIKIDAGGSDSGIIIENSSAYFRIVNCTVYNSGSLWGDAGIKLINVNNGTLINNNCSFDNKHGILLEFSNNNTIFNNIVNRNLQHGIILYNSDNNTISNNTVSENTAYNNIGIYLSNSDNNIIYKNRVFNNIYGIYLDSSTNNQIILNDLSSNAIWGIALCLGSNNNFIWGNTANENNGNGIFLLFCDNNNISRNTVINNAEGIKLSYSNNNTISANIINNNTYGIYLYYTNYNNVSWNTIVGNVFSITEANGCFGNIIENNTYYTKIMFAGINELEIEPYGVDNVDVNISIALIDDTKVFFSAFNETPTYDPLDNEIVFIELELNDTDNLDQTHEAPINITIIFDRNKYNNIKVCWFNSDANDGDGAWEEIQFTDLGNGLIVVSINHTSIFALTGEIKSFDFFPISSSKSDVDDGIDYINIFILLILAIIICSLSIITATSMHYYKTRSKTIAKSTQKETLNTKPLIKSSDKNIIKSTNIKEYVENKNLLRVLNDKNALEKPALFYDLDVTAISDEFWEKIEDFDLDDKDKVEFIKNMLSFTPEERQKIFDGIVKLKESDSENTNQQEYIDEWCN
ncbi:MAG: nitrous oxide reductase family maturation protein NosD [Candidatus Hodarchaeota archaeon]